MHPYVLIPLASGVAAAMVAGAVLGRDASHRAHRLTAITLGCSAYWSLLEVVWNSIQDPTAVLWLIRLSSLGWMPLGVLALHLFLEVGGDADRRIRRFLPWLYGAAAVSILIYIATPWGIESVFRTSWGWAFQHGPLFPLLYTPPATLALGALALLWRRLYPRNAPASERRQGRLLSAAIAIPLLTASTTDAWLPMLGIHVPRLGAASMTLLGVALAWSIGRDGYSLLTPGTFAPEILATLGDGVALLRRDGVVRVANASLARLCGCEPSDLLGRTVSDFLPDLAGATGAFDETECQLVPVATATREAPSPTDTTEPASAPGSDAPVPVTVSASILRDRDGEPVGQVLSIRDLREVVGLRNRLMMSGRLAAVGELAAGIAHEINNPIAYIQANLNLLQEHWTELEKESDGGPANARTREGHELIVESLTGVSRISAIVKDVKSFAHVGARERQEADLNEIIESTLRIADPQLRYRASIERDYGELPALWCNPQQLRQVLLNLLINAANAVAEGGTIRVSTRRSGNTLVASIADDGCGISPEMRSRIFDPFFTTQAVGEGLGLGLSISYRIVQDHGGDIQVESEAGLGSEFRIVLPLRADTERS